MAERPPHLCARQGESQLSRRLFLWPLAFSPTPLPRFTAIWRNLARFNRGLAALDPNFAAFERTKKLTEGRIRLNQVESALPGYPIDSTDHYGWCFGLFAPPTSILYGTGDTWTACCARR